MEVQPSLDGRNSRIPSLTASTKAADSGYVMPDRTNSMAATSPFELESKLPSAPPTPQISEPSLQTLRSTPPRRSYTKKHGKMSDDFRDRVEFWQTLYKFVPEHCEVKNVNRSLVDMKVGKCYKLSRTELYLNVSLYLRVDIPNDPVGQLLITGYQFWSNEYRKGPIKFMMGLCSAMASKDFDIPQMFSNSNIKCPLRKGVLYYVYKLSPNATNMPPLIPDGRWKIQTDYLYLNRCTIGSVEWYTGIEYPIIFE
ncbi:hypothetical protein ILUMI_17844 [Ignelater luminosus]|uniref:MD-2-related lipid-recognition domain-containing protein n=1 Tax=Ignelater luminosus TaxID=2038154 RepID=A0A8K0G6Y5_IGNLU|nr:hypothetical protein ILUMI_17844 [Ignelater luminosus]